MELKPYPKYKDLGIQGIDKIPEGWEVRKVKHLSTNLDEKRVPLSADVRKEGEIPYYGATGVLDYVQDYLFNETLLLIGEDGAPFFDKTKSVAYIIKGKSWVNNHAHVLRINKNLEISWLCYYLNTVDYSRYIKGSTRDKLNQDELSNIIVITPPLSDQVALANFLDKQTAKIDALIEKDKKLIALLKEKRTALINHAVTKGLDPNVKLKDSGIDWIGEIPEGWEVVPLKKYLETFVDYRGATPEKTDEGIFLVTGKNIKDGKIDYELSKEYVFEDQYEEVMHRGKPKIGDLLFTTEAPLGEVANVDYEKIALAQRIIKIRGKKQKLDDYYLKYYIKTQLFQSHLQSLATGSTALGLKASNWCFLRLIVPPLSEQNAIASYLDKTTSKIDKAIQKIEDKIKLLEEYKKSLIHYVVTGKVDVRGVEA